MDRIFKNNKKKSNKSSNEKKNKKRNNSNFSSILHFLIPNDTVTSDNNTLESVNTPNDVTKLGDDKTIINVLADDYESIFKPSDNTVTNNDVNNLPKFRMKKNSSSEQKENDCLVPKPYSPNKIKKHENSKELDKIILILKSEYRSITSAKENFEYSDFNSMDDNKRNVVLNKLEDIVFSSFQNLNQLSKLSSTNNEIKEALQEIFKLEDIINQSTMHAYNIYSFMKMYQYKRNFNTTDNDGFTNNLRFNKKQFDSVKFARDSEIRRLDSKSSASLSSNESLNLSSLKKERSEMEGYKSITRLDNLYKNRIRYLQSEITNSNKVLSGKISTTKTTPTELMTDLALKASLTAKNSVEILNDPSKFD